MLPRATFRPRERLRAAAAFRRVLRRGVRLSGRYFVLVAAENGRRYNRLGITASRKVGDATLRNRGKRLLRESFRRSKFEGSLDLVLILKPEIVGQGLLEVEREYRERIRRLVQRGTGLGRPLRAGGH